MLNLTQRFNHLGQSVAWGCLGHGEPLILIHGTPFSSQVWRRIAPILAKHWKVYFFDLIGYGQSEKHENQDVSLGAQNGLLKALINEWGLEKPSILCHDFGGATALRAYYLDDVRYKSLTIIDPVSVAPWGSPFVQHVKKYEAAFAGLPPYAHDAMLRAYLQTACHKTLTEDAFTAYMTPWQGEVGQAAFYRQIAQMDQKYTDEIEPQYGPMNCPVHLIWGRQDNWIPLAHGQKLAKELSVDSFTTIENCGHLVQEDAPEEIIGVMLS